MTFKETFKDKKFLAIYATVMVIIVIGILSSLMYSPEESEQRIMTSGQGAETREDIRSDEVMRKVKKMADNWKEVSDTPIQEKHEEWTIPIARSPISVAQQLINMGTPDEPLAGNFTGELKTRVFDTNSTLRDNAIKYVEADGYELIWDLDKDFRVMDRYAVRKTLTDMLDDIAGTVDSLFIGDVTVYVCHAKRAMVISNIKHDYLLDKCQAVNYRHT